MFRNKQPIQLVNRHILARNVRVMKEEKDTGANNVKNVINDGRKITK